LVLLGGEHLNQVKECPMIEVIGNVLAVEQENVNVGVIDLIIDFDGFY